MKKKLTLFFAILIILSGCTKQEINYQELDKNASKSVAIDKNVLVQQTAVAGGVDIDAGASLQQIRGFGGANIRGWIADLTPDQRIKAFSPIDGIGLSVVRVRVPNVSTLFAAEKPTIDAAKSFGASVIASAWSAPASMKDNNSTIGGKLKTTSFADYAAHLNSYCLAVGGVSAISPANEPNYSVSYESMNMTAAEVAAFVADQGGNCGAPIMGPEPYNMSQTYINSYLSNATANSNTAFVCGHIYGATPTAYSPGKEIWMTEHYTNSNDANDWAGALGVAKEVHNCMNAGYSMYVWWYIRRSYGFIDESSNVTKRGYVMAHYSKWVRPGFTRVSCTANPSAGIYITAYKNGQKLVIVIINENSGTVYQPFNFSGLSVSGFNRYVTSATNNLAQTNFSVTGGSFAINVAGSSVTTLVSQ